MTKINGMFVYQKQYVKNNRIMNEYYCYAPNRVLLGAVLLPPDGQYMEDHKTLNIFTKALMGRWRQTIKM